MYSLLPVRGGHLWQHSAVRTKDTKPVANRVMAMDSDEIKTSLEFSTEMKQEPEVVA